MLYEFLIVAEEQPTFAAKLGDIIAAHPAHWGWGEEERSSRFRIVKFNVPSEEHAELIRRDCYYDEANKVIRSRSDDIILNLENIVTRLDLPEKMPRASDLVAFNVDRNWRSKFASSCASLHPTYIIPYPTDNSTESDPFEPCRTYLTNKFMPFIAEPGMRQLIACFKFGDYGDVVIAARSLSQATKDKIMSDGSFTTDDKEWFTRVWKF